MKKCSRCKAEKEESKFHTDRSTKDGLKLQCKECSQFYRKRCYEKNKKKQIQILEKKVCFKCKKEKISKEFDRSYGTEDHLTSYCKQCNSARHKKYRQTIVGKYNRYKGDSKFRRREFLISLKEFIQFVNFPCVYCGEIEAGGIDRINSDIGYILTNCQSCCWICNYMKQSLTEEEFLNHIKKIYERKVNVSQDRIL